MGLSLAFVFAFVASWPKYITWGSNAFVTSFPLYFVCLSFLVYLVKNKLKLSTIFAIGTLFGYLAVLHIQVYETLLVSLILIWLYFVLKKGKERWNGLQNIIVTTSFSLLVLSPFIYRGLAFYSYPNHNIVPSDVELPTIQPSLTRLLDGVAFFYGHLALYPLFQIFSLLLILASISVIIIARRNNRLMRTGGLSMIGVATFLGQLLLFVLAALFGSPDSAGLLLPFPIFYPNQLLLYIPFYFFIASFSFHLYHFFSSLLTKKFALQIDESKLRTRKIMVPAISLTKVLFLTLGLFMALMLFSALQRSKMFS
jgi:hypothetical protein